MLTQAHTGRSRELLYPHRNAPPACVAFTSPRHPPLSSGLFLPAQTRKLELLEARLAELNARCERLNNSSASTKHGCGRGPYCAAKGRNAKEHALPWWNLSAALIERDLRSLCLATGWSWRHRAAKMPRAPSRSVRGIGAKAAGKSSTTNCYCVT